MRLRVPLLILALAALLGGCGGSSGGGSESTAEPRTETSTAPAGASARACALDAGGIEGLRVTEVSCGRAQRVALAWRASDACAKTGSRSACSVRSYRCLATATGRGWSVSCARKGESVAFTVQRG